MKELSIEQKAKAYDEAFERARVWKEKSGMLADKQGILDDIFPELKESEDEKIRKDIIVLVKDWWDRVNKDNISTKEQMIAWLEKQGEQRLADKVEPKFKVGDKIIKFSKTPCPVHDSTDDTVCEVVEVQDTCYILNTKEGKIQEPFEWQDYYTFVEPKTTWSERIKRNLKITFLPISALITSILKEQNTML